MRGHHSKALNAAQRTAGAGASQPEVDAFVDHLWLEAGLAKAADGPLKRSLLRLGREVLRAKGERGPDKLGWASVD